MLRKSDLPRLMVAGLKTVFMNATKTVTPLYPQITTEVPSDGASEEYGWLGATPQLREWKDERAPKALLEHGFTLRNKDYEASISVHRNTIKDEKYGQIKTRVQGMGTAAKKGYDRFLATVIEAGHTTECYDGQNFFDTDHSEGDSGTQSNYATSSALSITTAKAGISAMMKYKDDAGELVGVNPTHIMVPTELEWTAREIFDPKGTGDTNANTSLKGRLQIIVNPFLTSSTAWYLLDLGQAVKPFIYQNRQDLEYDDTTDSESNFLRKEIHFGVDARFAFGYGDRRYAYKGVA